MLDTLKKLLEVNTKLILTYGTSWSRYIVYKDILKLDEFNYIKKEIIEDSRIQAVYNRLFNNQLGVKSISNKPASYKVYGSYFWGLCFLADIGLTLIDLPLKNAVDVIFLYQMSDGQFTISYRRQNKTPVSAICLTANLIYSLVKLGYQNTRSVQAALNYILSTQRNDGGWHCDVKKQVGEIDEDTQSCPFANIQVIRALALYGSRYQNILQDAINQVYFHWQNPGTEFNCCDVGIGRIYRKLRYPSHYWGYDILNILDTLSMYPQFCRNSIFDEMIQSVISKWDGFGLFKSDKSIPGWNGFDFAKKNNPSSWISCIICRIVKRVYFPQNIDIINDFGDLMP